MMIRLCRGAGGTSRIRVFVSGSVCAFGVVGVVGRGIGCRGEKKIWNVGWGGYLFEVEMILEDGVVLVSVGVIVGGDAAVRRDDIDLRNTSPSHLLNGV